MFKKLIIPLIGTMLCCIVAGCGTKQEISPISSSYPQQIESSTQEVNTQQMSSSLPEGYQEKDFYGTLQIESVGLSVPVYCAEIGGLGIGAQEITDKEDSAAYFKYGQHVVIADHDYQGFDKLLQIQTGDTADIAMSDNQTEHYQCVTTAKGYNMAEVYIIMDTIEGEPLSTSISDPIINLFDISDNYLVMYTCNGSTKDIYITFWKHQS